jgi:hypothetical protein
VRLENPKLTELIASTPDWTGLTERLAKLTRALATQNKADSDLIDALIRILQSPNPQAERLKKLFKEVAK